jgi:hypothetical protein
MSVSRVALGLSLIAAPRLAMAGWLGRDAGRGSAHVLARALGARDMAIGAGVLASLGGGGSLRPWLLGGLVADATDLAATLVQQDDLPRTAVPLIASAAGAGIALGAYALTGGDGAAAAPAGASA